MKTMLRSLLVISVVVLVLAITGCPSTISDSNVQRIRASTLSEYPGKTVGQAIDGFLGSPRWSSGVSEDGTTFVNAKGSMLYMEKKVDALLQFKLAKDGKSFEIHALELNGIPQNQIMISALLQKMYE